MDEFRDLIESTEKEIEMQYIGGAIKWVDEKYDSAWSKAMDKFEMALVKAKVSKNLEPAKTAAIEYKNKCLGFISDYKNNGPPSKDKREFLETW